MQAFLSVYGNILRPWLSIVVYLWLLELLSVYGVRFEPILDSLADSSAILWTMIFWTALFCLAPATGGFVAPRSTLIRANERVCRASCLLISAYFLIQRLEAWRPEHPEREPVYWLALMALVVLYLLARRRRKHAPVSSPGLVPTWKDCLSFGVLPLLCLSAVILTSKSVDYFIAQRKAIAAAPGPTLQANHSRLPNVVVIVADSMRAPSMSLYGNSGDSTPFLVRLGKSSNVYLRMHANSTTTATSVFSLLSGKHPLTSGKLTRELHSSSNDNNMLSILRSYGYHTAAITSNGDAAFSSLGFTADLTHPEEFAFSYLTLSWLREFGVYPTRLGQRMYRDLAPFLPFLGFPERTSYHGHVDDTLKRAREAVAKLPQPFFIFIHIHEPHEPHLLPKKFQTIPIPASILGPEEGAELRFYSHYSPVFQPVVDAYKRQYESSVRAVDSGLEEFFGFLQGEPWFQDSLIVFTGDHGESFERGYFYHGEELYENSTWVPLIIRFPAQTTAKKIAALTQTVDITPTIFYALKIPVPDWMDGRALTPDEPLTSVATVAINYKHPDKDVSYPLPTKLAIWSDQFKMIIGCNDGSVELYDLHHDQYEQVNLAGTERPLVKDLKLKLKEHLLKQSHDPKLTCANL